MAETYNQEFFDNLDRTATVSAQIVLSELFQYLRPQSIIDIGCGQGAWLATGKKLGVEKIRGIDGPWVDQSQLKIPVQDFACHYLSQDFTTDINQKFDLGICLEVAEHLYPNEAEDFIGRLTKLSPVILFSAAIPGQGGTHHYNEQYPAYWENIFRKHNYVPVDFLRWQLWDTPDLTWWYKQNIVLFIESRKLADLPTLQNFAVRTKTPLLGVVHPERFNMEIKKANPSLTRWLKMSPNVMKTTVKKLTRKKI